VCFHFTALQFCSRPILPLIVLSLKNYCTDAIDSVHAYIIIDGGSTDGTIEIIESYRDKISYFKSEKDSGIYDAMNKGIKQATGKWLNFLNAGDIFTGENILKNIFENHIDTEVDLIYGYIVVRDELKKEIATVIPKNFTKFNISFWGTGTLCHQAMFVSSSIITPYSLKYKLKGELNWYFDLLQKVDKFKIVNFPIIVYTLGGVGDVNYKLNHLETLQVMFKRNGLLGILSIPFIGYSLLNSLLKKG
jgi:glycosyltransferase involved in cell wall biosynthesis